MQEKSKFVGKSIDIVEEDPFPEEGSPDSARIYFALFQKELDDTVPLLKGRSLEKKKTVDWYSKKIRKIVAKYFGMQFFEVGLVYIVRDGLNYVVKLRQDEEFMTLLRIHVDELKGELNNEV